MRGGGGGEGKCQPERYKTIWGCNHLAHRSPENKKNVGICWAKSFTGFKLDATYANIMQHSPTLCTNERNTLCPTCWHNMLHSFVRALTLLEKIITRSLEGGVGGQSDPPPLLLSTQFIRLT